MKVIWFVMEKSFLFQELHMYTLLEKLTANSLVEFPTFKENIYLI